MKTRDFMLELVTKHTKDNYDRLNKRNAMFDENIYDALKKNWWVLDNVLGDVLTREDFTKLGYVVSNKKDENDVWTVIYKFPGDVLVRQTCKKGEYGIVPYKFEFVKLIEKTVVTQSYEVLKPNEEPKNAEIAS